MFMDIMIHYYKNINSPQINLKIQCEPNQNTQRCYGYCLNSWKKKKKKTDSYRWECKEPNYAKTIMQNKARGLKHPDIKTNKAGIIKVAWYWYRIEKETNKTETAKTDIPNKWSLL